MFSSISPWPTGIKHGIIWGVIYIIILLITYIFGYDTNSLLGIILPIIFLVAVFVSVNLAHKKNDLGGYISFGRAYGVGLIAVVTLAVIFAIYMIVYVYGLQPDIVDMSIEKEIAKMEKAGDSKETIKMKLKITEPFRTKPIIIISYMFMHVLGAAALGLMIAGVIGSANRPRDDYVVPKENE